MSLLSANDLVLMFTLILSFFTVLTIAYLLLTKAANFYFLILIGLSSLLFSVHHMLEISVNINSYYLSEFLETGSSIAFLAAVLSLKKS